MNKLIEAVHTFLRKVDLGQARSVKSYEEMTEALQDPRIIAYKAIDSERDFQDDKWGADKRHDVGGWILLMEEAVLKARQAWYKAEGDEEALSRIRVATSLGIACMEAHGAPLRKEILTEADSTKWIVKYKHSRSDLFVYISTFEEGEEKIWQVSTTIDESSAKEFTSWSEATRIASLLQEHEDHTTSDKKVQFIVAPPQK